MPSLADSRKQRGSENKLLQTAELDLPAAGDWTVNIAISRNSESADLSLPVRVVKRGEWACRFLAVLPFSGFWHDPVWDVCSEAPRADSFASWSSTCRRDSPGREASSCDLGPTATYFIGRTFFV